VLSKTKGGKKKRGGRESTAWEGERGGWENRKRGDRKANGNFSGGGGIISYCLGRG